MASPTLSVFRRTAKPARTQAMVGARRFYLGTRESPAVDFLPMCGAYRGCVRRCQRRRSRHPLRNSFLVVHHVHLTAAAYPDSPQPITNDHANRTNSPLGYRIGIGVVHDDVYSSGQDDDTNHSSGDEGPSFFSGELRGRLRVLHPIFHNFNRLLYVCAEGTVDYLIRDENPGAPVYEFAPNGIGVFHAQ